MQKNIGEQAREPEEGEFDPQYQERNKQFNLEKLESERAMATELQREVASGQATSLETSVLTIMRRTAEDGKNNVELVNALAKFLQALEFQAGYGPKGPSEPIGKGAAKDLTEFLEEASKALRWKAGAEPVSGLGVEEADFSRWEAKKK